MRIRIHNLVNQYLLETPRGWIAIDTGYPGGEGRYLRRLGKLAEPEALRAIVLTHAHDDHAGFLGPLSHRTGAKVVLHRAAIPRLLAGRNEMPPAAGYSCRAGALFGWLKRSFAFPPVELGHQAAPVSSQADQPFWAMGLPIRVLLLPGHTVDSIGLLLEETGDLFCGDAAMNAGINAARHTLWIEDPRAFGRSWDAMLALRPAHIYPSHGAPFPPGDLVRFRRYLDGTTLLPPRRS